MKKVYATMLAASFAVSPVFAQNLTPVWTKHYDMEVGQFDTEAPDWNSPASVKQSAGMRNAIGLNGKLYGIDMRTMSVTAFDANGATKAFDLPSLAGQTINYVKYTDAVGTQSAPDYYGSLISRDDAGHLLIGHGYNTGAVAYTWTVLDPATGATKRLVAEPAGVDITSCLPVDLITRAIGDVTKEGYLYVAPNSIFWPEIKTLSWGSDHMTVQRGKILSFKGDGTVANTSMELSFTNAFPLGNWFRNSLVPLYNLEGLKAAMAADPANVTLNQAVWVYSKALGGGGMYGDWDVNCGIMSPDENYKLLMGDMKPKGSDLTGINCAEYEAIDYFTLGGKGYFVAAYNDDSQYKHNGLVQFGIFDETEGYLVDTASGEPAMWSYEGEWTDEAYQVANAWIVDGTMNINAEPVDENNVNIYVWAQAPGNGVFAGVFNFGNGNTGVTDVNVEANDAAPVYYNLNGVRVENPANGIFIEKRGSKVSKVIK